MKTSVLIAPLAVLAAAIALLTAGPAAAGGMVNCAPYGSGTAASVQLAATFGGTVTINGVCKGTVHLSVPVTLHGGTAGATSGLDGNGVGPVITVDGGATVTLSNMLVTGGACKCEGAGVEVVASILNVVGSKIVGNHASSFGGGIDGTTDFHTGQGSVLNLTDSTVSGNSGLFGGGIMSNGGTPLTLTRTTVSNNTASGPGGGIFQGGTQLTVNSSTISGNHGTGGGGISLEEVTGSISHSTITGNNADFGGGGILAQDENHGNATGLTISNSSLDHNTAADEGGALLNLSFYGDSYVSTTGTSFTANSAPFGGAVNNSGQGATASFSGTADTFLGNHADHGEGGAIFNEAIYDFSVGLITLSQSQVGPTLGTMNANTANDGGAIYNFVYPGYHGLGQVTLQNGTTVSHNSASDTGGGVDTCAAGVLNLLTGGRVVMNAPNNVVSNPCA
jgi:hypothetical protein